MKVRLINKILYTVLIISLGFQNSYASEIPVETKEFVESTETTNIALESAIETQESENIVISQETEYEETEPEEITSDNSSEAVTEVDEETFVNSYTNTGVYDFVQRLYRLILGREPDEKGIREWYECLINGNETGVGVADGFVFSQEFINKSLNDGEYVEILYKTLLNRNSDENGKTAWIEHLEQGVSRYGVFRGFANSVEFKSLCEEYGISAGTAEIREPRDKNDYVTMFIYRCYEKFLGRKPDISGLNAWVEQIVSGNESAKRAVYGFVFSQEFRRGNLPRQSFVETLYEGIFDRQADAQGLQDWLNLMVSGGTRFDVFKGFVESQEFKQLLNKFNINDKPDSLNDLNENFLDTEALAAKTWIIYDGNNGDILYGKNLDSTVQLASQTKLMTAIVVLESISDLNQTVTMTQSAYDDMTWDTTVANLIVGEEYTIKNLMEGMLVYSGADCANLMAEYVGGGSREQFVELMNQKAQELGMSGTHFSDPMGLYSNYSTPREYIKLVNYALNKEAIKACIGKSSCVMVSKNGIPGRLLMNSNLLVSGTMVYDKSLYLVDGVKTGSTDEAGYCLTASAYNGDGNRVIAAVFNSSSHYKRSEDVKIFYDWIFTNQRNGVEYLAPNR